MELPLQIQSVPFLSHYPWQVWWWFSFVLGHEIWWNVKVCHPGKSLCESTTAGKFHLLWRLLSLSLWRWLWRMQRPWGDSRDVKHHNHIIIINDSSSSSSSLLSTSRSSSSPSPSSFLKGAPWNQRCLQLYVRSLSHSQSLLKSALRSRWGMVLVWLHVDNSRWFFLMWSVKRFQRGFVWSSPSQGRDSTIRSTSRIPLMIVKTEQKKDEGI